MRKLRSRAVWPEVFRGAVAVDFNTERLLELIDGFAAAEGRMKWAPNKKLHFEIALIKAIQNLGQNTLTEVIDALTTLREGDPPFRPTAPVRQAAAPAPVPVRSCVESRPPLPPRSEPGPALKKSVTRRAAPELRHGSNNPLVVRRSKKSKPQPN